MPAIGVAGRSRPATFGAFVALAGLLAACNDNSSQADSPRPSSEVAATSDSAASNDTSNGGATNSAGVSPVTAGPVQADDDATSSTSEQVEQDLSIPLSIAEVVPPSPATSEVIWAAQQKLVRECMAERGFDYVELPSPQYEQSWVDGRASQTMTAERAESVAYHPLPVLVPPELEAAYAALEQRTSDSAFSTALGAQPGEAGELGCNIVAQQQINGEVDLQSDDFERVIGDGEQQIVAEVLADPDYSAAVSTWAACMSSAGYDYASPEDAFNDPRWSTAEPDDVERSTARQDAACREQSNLNTVMRQAQRSAVAAWMTANEAFVSALRDAENELLDRAQEILDQ